MLEVHWMVDRNRQLLVIGRGLIGKSVQNYSDCYEYSDRFDWTAPETVPSQLEECIGRFLDETPSWAIAWCAGNATVASSPQNLEIQLALFESALCFIEARSKNQPDGRVFLASSAGGIYGSGSSHRWTNDDQPSPRSPYGEMKVRQERALAAFGERSSIITLSGRIANAYGSAQDPVKPQGLISVALRSALTRRPLQIHVPLETTRDYIFESDIGRFIGSWVNSRSQVPSGTAIIATGRSVSIFEVLRCVRLVANRACPIVQRRSETSLLQPLHIRLRPGAGIHPPGEFSPTPLEHGMSAVWKSLLHGLQLPHVRSFQSDDT
jgi:UDP-glucose 4-epimerase